MISIVCPDSVKYVAAYGNAIFAVYQLQSLPNHETDKNVRIFERSFIQIISNPQCGLSGGVAQFLTKFGENQNNSFFLREKRQDLG